MVNCSVPVVTPFVVPPVVKVPTPVLFVLKQEFVLLLKLRLVTLTAPVLLFSFIVKLNRYAVDPSILVTVACQLPLTGVDPLLPQPLSIMASANKIETAKSLIRILRSRKAQPMRTVSSWVVTLHYRGKTLLAAQSFVSFRQ